MEGQGAAIIPTLTVSLAHTASGIWVMGAAGSIPILIILVVLLVSLVLVVVGIVSFFLWRRRRAATTTSSRNKDPFAACRDPLMPQPQTADQFPTNNTNVSPIYRSPPPPPPPNYYSEWRKLMVHIHTNGKDALSIVWPQKLLSPWLLANSIDLSRNWQLVGFLFLLFLLPLARIPILYMGKHWQPSYKPLPFLPHYNYYV